MSDTNHHSDEKPALIEYLLSILNIKSALSFKPLILEKSLLWQTCLKFDFQDIEDKPRVPCTHVSLGEHAMFLNGILLNNHRRNKL